MKKLFHVIITSLFYLSVSGQSNARIEIQVSDNQLNIGENFSVTVAVLNVKNIQSPVFPIISGFDKQDVQSSQQTSISNGKFTSYYKFVQNYKSKKAGVFVLKPFVISIGGVSQKHNGAKLIVNKDKGNVYLELTAGKKVVFKGEPVRLSLNLWYDKVSAKSMRLGNRTTQKVEQLKQYISSRPVWVEEISNADLNGKQLQDGSIVYGTRIIDMVITPQSTGVLRFDTMDLDVIKTFGYNQESRTYFSSHVDIVVKDLPSNSSRDLVVGMYQLVDKISVETCETGDELIYEYKVKGEGNLPFLDGPKVFANDSLLITKLDENLSFDNSTGQMLGEKIFKYSIVPQVAGVYNVKDYFKLDVFDFKGIKITHLVSDLKFNVSGQSMIVDNSSKVRDEEKMDVIFDPVVITNDEFVIINQSERLNLITNLLLLLLIGGLGFLIYKDLRSKDNKTS